MSLIDDYRTLRAQVARLNARLTALSGSVADVTDHGDLTGLTPDDDHPQYLKTDGTRDVTGAMKGVTPTLDAHLATKKYVDDNIGGGGGGDLNDLNDVVCPSPDHGDVLAYDQPSGNWINSPGFVAEGGSITYDGNYVIHTFTSSGTFKVAKGGKFIELLVVAGGGGGGEGGAGQAQAGGGGGGGGVLEVAEYPVNVGNFDVVIGAGGDYHANGADSSFEDQVATGGGAGGNSSSNGQNGGCGGGGGNSYSGYGNGVSGQGYHGGPSNGSWENAGGGGGAGAVGGSGTTNTGGNGGAGRSTTIRGTTEYFGGGGGGWGNTTGGAGGSGGGGNGDGGVPGSGGSDGSANTGGGGGSEHRGGSGVVIVRYLMGN